jgi:dipeptidyl-peptidase 4
MKRFLFLASFVFFLSSLSAQEKMLNLADVFRDPSLYPVSMNQLQWRGNLNSFTFVEGSNLMEQAGSADSATSLLSLAKLNEAMLAAGFKEFKRFPGHEWESESVLLIYAPPALYTYDLSAARITMISKLPEDAENVEYGKGSRWAAYTMGDALYVLATGEEVAVAEPEEDGIVYGKTVSRNEFGIGDGIFWSPDGRLLAFYKKDERQVTQYPLVDVSARVAELNNTRYPMAGMNSETIQVGVYNPANRKTIYLHTGSEPNEYLTNITWSPDNRFIFVAELNREQNHMHLNMYDAASGECVRTLFEEKDGRYVEPLHGPIFDPALPLGQFIWQSSRDGFNHLYLYDYEGKMIRQLTKGQWMVTDFLGFGPKGKDFYIMGTMDSPLERHLYRVDFVKGKMQKITPVHGSHEVQLSHDKSLVLDDYSSTDIAGEYLQISTSNLKYKVIKANVDPLKDYKLGEMSIFTLKAEDGSDLYCRLIKPINFDPAKKYPVIVYLYGGPHAQMITDSWTGGAGYYLHYLAQQGYVVFTLDNRGSAARGVEFESIIHRRLGEVEVIDQKVGIDYLLKQPWIDKDRLGIHGWSYGGFMTINMMLSYPGLFKVGVAGGPVIDWKWYEVMYGERYMDTPEENAEGYQESALINRIDKLEGKLLIIHGAADATVVMQHSLAFLKASVDKQKQVDFFVYPGHEHNVRGKDRLHLWNKISTYFSDFL